MTRIAVVYEGVDYPDGRFIKPGAIEMEDELIPVARQEAMDEIIGAARALQRGDDGEVTLDVVLFDFVARALGTDLENCYATVYMMPVEVIELEGKVIITKGRLRELILNQKNQPHINGTQKI